MRMTINVHRLLALLALSASMLLGGCATQKPGQDYTAFRQAKPASILVLPPINDSPDVNASFSVLAQATVPLAEAGYYVMPVTLVNEAFHQNGLNNPPEMHDVTPAKLRDIFGADAALYMKVKRYGASYTVFNSVVQVDIEGRLVDLRTGQQLWEGKAFATNDNGNNSGGGLIGALISAAIKHVINNVSDVSHGVAGQACNTLLTAGRSNSLLYGPRSPRYGQEGDGR